MSIGMSFYPQAVVLKGRVYVGGGSAINNAQNSIVMCYNIERNQWTILPEYHLVYFAMTAINEELVLVGGRHPTTNRTTRAIRAWSESLQTWVYSVQTWSKCTLPTARDAVTAITHDNRWLIVAGGREDGYRSLSRVDILNLPDCQWYSGARLPQPTHKMSAAVISNTLVLLGGATSANELYGTGEVFSVQLDDLISQAVSDSRKSDHALASVWLHLPHTPVVSCTALAFNAALLAIGGNKSHMHDPTATTCGIHMFKPSTRTWAEAGQLQINRWRCACTVLPSDEILIAGGAGGPTRPRAVGEQLQREVHIAALQ